MILKDSVIQSFRTPRGLVFNYISFICAQNAWKLQVHSHPNTLAGRPPSKFIMEKARQHLTYLKLFNSFSLCDSSFNFAVSLPIIKEDLDRGESPHYPISSLSSSKPVVDTSE